MNRIDQLKRLGDLRKSEALSEEDFAREKAIILEQADGSSKRRFVVPIALLCVCLLAALAAFAALRSTTRSSGPTLASGSATPASALAKATATGEAAVRSRQAAPALMETSTDVKALIAQEERENDSCRGGSGDDPDTMRACNRRQLVLKQLQDTGWCWGGGQIEADKHFVECKPGDTDYQAGAFDKPYYNEADIVEASQAHDASSKTP